METTITKTPLETKIFAKKMAEKFLLSCRNSKEKALVIGLKGDLGGGKTIFVQGFAKGLRIEEKILSPTFVILRKFLITNQQSPISGFNHFYHIDCYRIQRPEELLELGFKEIVLNPENIVIIEWPNRVDRILPKEMIILRFEFIDKRTRRIVLE